ncbi:MAG: hypothetical protein V8S42_03075 [Lachnospiraceae bacterium]
MRKEGLESLKALQREILKNAVSYVKPGGILLYSTCTINQGENEENAVWLTRQFPFGLESLSPYLPEVLKEEGKDGMLQLIPGVHETDGFFIARLKNRRINRHDGTVRSFNGEKNRYQVTYTSGADG